MRHQGDVAPSLASNPRAGRKHGAPATAGATMTFCLVRPSLIFLWSIFPVHYQERFSGESKMVGRFRNAMIMLRMCWAAFLKFNSISGITMEILVTGSSGLIGYKAAGYFAHRGRQVQGLWRYDERNRKGDHICYISNMAKFREHYPGWSLSRRVGDIVEEMVSFEQSHGLTVSG